MREIRMSGLMSGDPKRDALHTRAGPRLYPISNFPRLVHHATAECPAFTSMMESTGRFTGLSWPRDIR
jgi:hypothetical protein